MAPIAELTAAAREIERTRDPARRVPTTEADDEVAELSRTLDGMLRALDDSRHETEAALQRQREFVADASHELRTPLTSVLANLELLAETLDGERGEAAASALRSSRRMRRLVADLLLLARADAERHAPHTPTDVGEVLMEAAGELSAVADGHELHIDADHAIVSGARDELHRLALNLMENAIRHTPSGTSIRAGVEQRDATVVLTVEDDGPGIDPELRERVFERFVRGSGDSGALLRPRALDRPRRGGVARRHRARRVAPRRRPRRSRAAPASSSSCPRWPRASRPRPGPRPVRWSS